MTGGWPRPRLHPSGDSLLLVELGSAMDLDTHARVMAMTRAIGAAALPGVRDVVPAYTSVGVHVDPLRLDVGALERVVAHAWDAGPSVESAGVTSRATREIPVCYGGPHGPDLAEVAEFAGCSTEQVIRRHAAVTYRVFMLGFLPGFAYLGTVDQTIAMARHAAPREAVPEGSVGIAGRQTGVYPAVSPGGWRLIGRTPWRMFDQQRRSPALLQAGDTVRFVPVPADQWDVLAAGPHS